MKVFAILRLVLLGLAVVATAQAETRVALVNGRWQINGELTYRSAPAEGLLMNVRMVNATFTGRNNGTRPRGFDPDTNAHHFIDRIPDYAGSGVRAFTLCLQGGMPGYEGAQNSAFAEDGTLRVEELARVARVIRACDSHGVVVILGLFYQRQTGMFRDDEAIRAAVRNAVRWVEQERFTNVLVEIANEYPHSGFAQELIRTPAGMASLLRLAKTTAPQLLFTASSYGNGIIHAEVAAACDFLTPHFNSTPVAEIPKRLAALRQYQKPIVCNEDAKTKGNAAAALRTCAAEGVGYGLMLQQHNQTYPFHFEGPADDPEFYAALRELTTPRGSH